MLHLASLLTMVAAVSLFCSTTQAQVVIDRTMVPKVARQAIAGQYIVHLKKGNKGLDVAREHSSRIQNHFEAIMDGFSAELSDNELQRLQNDPRVELIEPDSIVTIDQQSVDLDEAVTTDAVQGSPIWNLDRIDQRALPLNNSYIYTRTGAGVTAYVVDSGIRFNHEQFGGRAVRGFDALGGTGGDCNGHGTHVAGTIGGVLTGVAKGVRLVSVRVVNCDGSGTVSQVLAGLDWIRKNGKRPGVVNMSLGSAANVAIDNAVKSLIASGFTVVTSAGNSNVDACTQSPARVGAAITVGASTNTDARAAFSNWGRCVDFFAPGQAIISAYHSEPSVYASMSGTSQAAPHVAGMAALHLQRFPFAPPAFVRTKLFELTTKAKVVGARSVNNHLLFAYRPTDTVLPTTAISAPRTGASVRVGSPVTIAASAADNAKVEVVEFIVNGQVRCRDFVAPFTCAWTPPTRGTTYSITSRAIDSAGNPRPSAVISVRGI